MNKIDQPLKEKNGIYEVCCQQCNSNFSFEKSKLPKNCPSCDLPFWYKPRNERILFTLQEKYYEKNKCSDVLSEIFKEFVDYGKILLKSRLRKESKSLHHTKVEEAAYEVAVMYCSRYLKQEDYKIEHSFGEMIKQSLLFPLYGKDIYYDRHPQSLEDVNPKTELTLLESMDVAIQKDDKRKDLADDLFEDKDEPFRKLDRLLEASEKSIRNNFGLRESLLFLIGLNQKLKSKDAVVSNEFSNLYPSRAIANISKFQVLMRKTLKGEFNSAL